MQATADFRLRPQRGVAFTPIAKNFMLYCRLIYMLSILCVILTIKVKVGIPENFKVGWYPQKKTGSSHLNGLSLAHLKEEKIEVIKAYDLPFVG